MYRKRVHFPFWGIKERRKEKEKVKGEKKRHDNFLLCGR